MKNLFKLGFVALMLGITSNANAHTIAIGTVNGGAPGAVDLYMGSYHGLSEDPVMGSITIDGTTYAFAGAGGGGMAAAPGFGLTVGTNLFFADNGATGSYTALTAPCCTLTTWQVASITGLSAGWHSYTISGMTTVHWSDWNSSQSNWTGRIFIPGSSTGTVPEPALLGLLGFGMVGIGAARRRRLKK